MSFEKRFDVLRVMGCMFGLYVSAYDAHRVEPLELGRLEGTLYSSKSAHVLFETLSVFLGSGVDVGPNVVKEFTILSILLFHASVHPVRSRELGC